MLNRPTFGGHITLEAGSFCALAIKDPWHRENGDSGATGGGTLLVIQVTKRYSLKFVLVFCRGLPDNFLEITPGRCAGAVTGVEESALDIHVRV